MPERLRALASVVWRDHGRKLRQARRTVLGMHIAASGVRRYSEVR